MIDQGFSKAALLGSKPPHPRLIKSGLPVGRDRAQPATHSFTLFLGREGGRGKRLFRIPACLIMPCWQRAHGFVIVKKRDKLQETLCLKMQNNLKKYHSPQP